VTAFLTREGVRLLYPLPGDRARLYVQVRSGEFNSIKRRGIDEWIAELLEAAPGLRRVAQPLRASAAHVQLLSAWRLSAESWTRPGLALLGDAAHCVHPMAGQGMNAAIGDAWALTRALGEAAPLDAAGVDAALERYERERRPRLEYVSRLSHNLARVFTDTSPLARRLYGRMLRVNSANRRLQYILTYNVSGLGVRRFTRRDRLYQFGILSDPRAGEAGL
jgi:2-polyprenyl-6-methoxyphenol hydroxylase-like FAD-dependent oxidoreductase